MSEQSDEGILESKLARMLHIHDKGRLTGPIWQVGSMKGRTMRCTGESLRGIAHHLRNRNEFSVLCRRHSCLENLFRENCNSPVLFHERKRR